MQDNKEVNSIVISPSRNVGFREGRGFSLKEINQAGRTVQELKKMKVQIDFLRKSAHKENIDILKNLKAPKDTSKRREPFIPKERRRTEFKPKVEKITAKEKEISPPKKAVAVVEPAPIKQESKKVKAESNLKKEGIPLTELSGLGSATEQKFIELGVASIEDLLLEDPSELSQLIKGCSEERIKKWVDEAKDLVRK